MTYTHMYFRHKCNFIFYLLLFATNMFRPYPAVISQLKNKVAFETEVYAYIRGKLVQRDAQTHAYIRGKLVQQDAETQYKFMLFSKSLKLFNRM
jgi:hypothetical protein